MKVLVAIPWRPNGDLYRARNYNAVRKHFEAAGYEVWSAEGPAGRFNRSAARNECAYLAAHREADVVVINDADCLPPLDQVAEAARAAFADGRLHYPFGVCQYLGHAETEAVLHGHEVEATHAGYASGGSFVMAPTQWQVSGGMDERLASWGGEDDAFYVAASTLTGRPVHHQGVMWHLYHGRDEIAFGTDEHEANLRLLQRYSEASGDREAMQALVNEWRP